MYPFEFFRRACLTWPNRVALEADGRGLSFCEVEARALALATGLQSIDPDPQSRIGICAYNTVEHVLALLAVLAAGKTWVPLNPRNGKAEINAMIAAVRPTIIIADPSCLDRFDAGGATVVPTDLSSASDAALTLVDLIDRFYGQMPRDLALSLDAIQAIKFTSGSSGRPKGVLQSYRCWNTHIVSIADAFGFDQDDRFLAAAPVTHGTSCFLLPMLMAGGTVVLLNRPEPARILRAFESEEISGTFLTPTMIYMLMAEPDVAAKQFPRLRHLIYSGAPMRPEQIATACKVFPGALETCYGQAEAPQIISYMRAADFLDPGNHGSVGQPGLLVKVAIMDPDGRLLPPGENGEIVVRGDLLMNGYLDMPEETAQTIRDGWLHTGDVGVIDERGYLFIKDRIRDMIITGGFNVFPTDVEAALGRHPAVQECSVFGVEDSKWGEAVHAAVELHEGAEATESELIQFVKDALDSVKAPKRIHFLDRIPRSAVGKIQRRAVRDIVLSGLGTTTNGGRAS